MSNWTSEFFTEKEMACNCEDCNGLLSTSHFDSSLKLARSLDVARRIIGVPIIVTSAGRCMKHHRAIYRQLGRTKDTEIPLLSRHLFFDAADLKIRVGREWLSGLEMKGMFEVLIKLKHIPNGGLGTYTDQRSNILHYDHGDIRRWSD